MKQKMKLIVALAWLLPAVFLSADEPRQVMLAKRRTEIIVTAKALFEPQVRNSLKVGKVESPFAGVPSK